MNTVLCWYGGFYGVDGAWARHAYGCKGSLLNINVTTILERT